MFVICYCAARVLTLTRLEATMKFERIEIHFKARGKDGKEEDRKVVIERGSKVKGIILNSGEPPRKDIPKIDGMKLVGGDVNPGDGPGVCYDTIGGLQCW